MAPPLRLPTGSQKLPKNPRKRLSADELFQRFEAKQQPKRPERMRLPTYLNCNSYWRIHICFIIGRPASGKRTLARQVAARYGSTFCKITPSWRGYTDQRSVLFENFTGAGKLLSYSDFRKFSNWMWPRGTAKTVLAEFAFFTSDRHVSDWWPQFKKFYVGGLEFKVGDVLMERINFYFDVDRQRCDVYFPSPVSLYLQWPYGVQFVCKYDIDKFLFVEPETRINHQRTKHFFDKIRYPPKAISTAEFYPATQAQQHLGRLDPFRPLTQAEQQHRDRVAAGRRLADAKWPSHEV